jgi:hypothetical protein
MATAPWAAIVEIVADSAGALPVALIRSGYIASAFGPVAFVLEGVEAAVVDRVLAAVVGDPLEVHGVQYCSRSDVPLLVAQYGVPCVGVARTRALIEVLEGLGITPVAETHALAALADLEDTTPPKRPGPPPLASRRFRRAPEGHSSI